MTFALRSSVAALLLMMALGASADDFRPLYIEITEISPLEFVVRLRVPPRVTASNEPTVAFPSTCNARGGGMVGCEVDPAGSTIELAYPAAVPPIATVVRLAYASGESHTRSIGAGTLEIPLPPREEVAGIAAQYSWLGVEHIWRGLDHLLFVLCLIWIAGTWQRVLVTITGFTIAHSATLVLAALDVLVLPTAPIEAVIALSVLFLAKELVRGEGSLTWRYPVVVSSSFGLLHGLGFAAVLGEIGLPQLELLTGLVAFNVGVEVGQVCFAGAVMVLLAAARRTSAAFVRHGQVVTAYAVGSVAAYWLIDRTFAFVA